MVTVGTERYALYGVIAEERDVNTKPMTLEEQNVGDSGLTLLYETDDPTEAREIYEAGGFERDGVWHVVTRAEDRLRRASSASTHSLTNPVPRKTDYDQQ
jgi:hypothetical protein